MSSQFKLLNQRRFGPFFLTQLTGAFNDNLFKQVLVLLVTYHAAKYSSLDPALLTNLAAGLFILPFVLFSALAGQLADRFDKTTVLRTVKAAEVGIMALAALGLYRHDITMLLASLFLMGTHSAFFGPAKYSMLPQVLKREELVGGNGLLEMGTFMAILGGTVAAGVLVSSTTAPSVLSTVFILLALAGLGASLAIPRVPAAAPDLKLNWNPFTGTMRNIEAARKNRVVWLSLLGVSWFWFYGAMLLSQIPTVGKQVLQGTEGVVTLLLAIFSVGVAIGSLLCEKLSNQRVEIGLVPLGSIGLTVFGFDLFFALQSMPAQSHSVLTFLQSFAGWRVLADLAFVGGFGGLYIVPLYALIQTRSNPAEQSRVIAANNILNAVFMVAAAGMAAGLLVAGVPVLWLIAVCAGLNALVALYIYRLVPEFLWRFLAWCIAHSAYQMKVEGKDRIPEEGAALLCPNHVTYADALFISALTHRPVRFVMDHAIFKSPVLGWLFRAMKAIPIASAKSEPEVLHTANEAIAKALAEGELVCLFPEGQLTRTGRLNEFRSGATMLSARSGVRVFPIGLTGLWGSALSADGRPPLKKLWSGKGRRQMTVRVGEPLSAGVNAEILRTRVGELYEAPLGRDSKPMGPERRRPRD